MHSVVRIAVAPASSPSWVADSVREGGGEVVDGGSATGVVWTDARDAEGLAAFLREYPHIGWVQVPFAGVENFIPIIDDSRLWTCGKGVYAEPVAEHALALMLAGMRHIGGYARADSWSGPVGRNLLGADVTIVGGGGITESLVRLLGPFGCRITVVRRHVSDMVGVDTVVETGHLVDALVGADVVVLALALTPETTSLMSRAEFSVMEKHAWLVNVARGAHVVTEDLVWALETGEIAGACLDVTNPEPLPAAHRLWSLDNCIITPHVGNTPEMAIPLLAERIRSNVHRYRVGEELLGRIDIRRGY